MCSTLRSFNTELPLPRWQLHRLLHDKYYRGQKSCSLHSFEETLGRGCHLTDWLPCARDYRVPHCVFEAFAALTQQLLQLFS